MRLPRKQRRQAAADPVVGGGYLRGVPRRALAHVAAHAIRRLLLLAWMAFLAFSVPPTGGLVERAPVRVVAGSARHARFLPTGAAHQPLRVRQEIEALGVGRDRQEV